MIAMQKHIFILALLVLTSMGLSAQTEAQVLLPVPSRWKLRADFFHQDLAFQIPFGQLGVYHKPVIRPGFALGGEYTYQQRKHLRLYQSAHLGYYNNVYEERWGTLGTELGMEWEIWKGILIAPRIGLQYNLVKPSDLRYMYEGDKWVPVRNTDPAFSRLGGSIGLDLGYRVCKGAHPIDVLANGNVSIAGPYIKGSFPFYFFKSAGVGLRVGI
jgi:hypothetical protein